MVTAISGGTDPDGWVGVPADEKMGAGIGGSQGCGSGDINISGGTVTAYGGYDCPGIGGAPCDVTISGNAAVSYTHLDVYKRQEQVLIRAWKKV